MSKVMAWGSGVLVLALVLAAVAFVRGWTPSWVGSDTARPPCESLPVRADVVAALEEHQDVTRRLAEVAPGTSVELQTPCEGAEAGRALLRVTVPSAGRAALEEWINTHDGYGVPLEIVTG
ncbi:hypothetical protein [Nocardioides sp.]|uniref:hypothetical protein n=1 Tax=Nocardioides sp. TaxID=35761 RepID=UPI0035132465